MYKHNETVYEWVSDDNKGLRGWYQRNNNNWYFSVGNNVWYTDPSLTILPGGLQVTCRNYQVTATGPAADHYRKPWGQFTVTSKWRNGRPVYTSSNGHMLYVCNSGQWCIGDKVGVYGIRSRDTPGFPDRAKLWVYWDGSVSQEAQVSVICVSGG